MMLKVLSLIIAFPIFINAQNSFELLFQDSITISCISSFRDNQDYYLSIGGRENPTSSLTEPIILKFQDTDSVIVKKFPSNDLSRYFSFGKQLENNNYFLVGSTINEPIQLFISEVNQDFEFENEYYYQLPDIYEYFSILDIIFEDDGSTIIYGMLGKYSPSIQHIFLAKINVNGELEKSNIYSDQYNDFSGEILKKPDGSGYLLLGSFLNYNLIEIDNELNVVGFKAYEWEELIGGRIGARFLSNDNIIIASLGNFGTDPNAFYDFRVSIINTELEVLKDTIVYDDGKNRLPQYSGLDFVDEDNIWAVTHLAEFKSKGGWEKGRIFILDSEMNIKGSKYFGGDIAKSLLSLKALEDGGCIITGLAPKSGKNDEKGNYDVYIKKVMPEDIITKAEETPALDDSDVLLYPIPFGNILNIETYRNDLSLFLYDGKGKSVVVRHSLNVPYTSLNTGKLPPGVYLYSIYDQKKVIESGKIIKQ